jgi:hypothetical protein
MQELRLRLPGKYSNFSRISSGDAFAYSIKMSKYFCSLKTPVSCISNLVNFCASFLLQKLYVGIFLLRVFVEHFQIGMGGSGIRKNNILFNIFLISFIPPSPKNLSLRIGSCEFHKLTAIHRCNRSRIPQFRLRPSARLYCGLIHAC